MSNTTKVLLVLVAVAVIGGVIYFSTVQQAPTRATQLTGPAGTASGFVRSIGSGLVAITALITGAVEAGQDDSGSTGEPPAEEEP